MSHSADYERDLARQQKAVDLALLRVNRYALALQKAYDAIAHAENYRQEPHVAKHLSEAKVAIFEAMYGEQNDGFER